MKLELKHLAPYGNVGCKYLSRENNQIPFDFEDLYDIQCAIQYETFEQENYKLILRPLSDLEKERSYVGQITTTIRWTHHLRYENKKYHSDWSLICAQLENEEYLSLPYWVIEKLLEWHFDFFGLIEKGLAIDINTL